MYIQQNNKTFTLELENQFSAYKFVLKSKIFFEIIKKKTTISFK